MASSPLPDEKLDDCSSQVVQMSTNESWQSGINVSASIATIPRLLDLPLSAVTHRKITHKTCRQTDKKHAHTNPSTHTWHDKKNCMAVQAWSNLDKPEWSVVRYGSNVTMPAARTNAAMTFIGQDFYIFGGVIQGDYANDLWVLSENGIGAQSRVCVCVCVCVG